MVLTISSTQKKYSSWTDVELADVFLFDYHDSKMRERPDGKADHAAIVTGFTREDRTDVPLISYHSNNRLDVPWYFFYNAQGGDYWVQHINR
ncbi:amidase domain-containing protein [Brevibacillus parabrevis]|uniref:amidase domain-containing protein n=1 Tax=Brevibacillus parabrevis TaxID=54914 RepID=UPI00399C65F8